MNEGDLRVWWTPQMTMLEYFHVPVKSVKDGALIYAVLAQYDLFQFENNIKPDYANCGGLEVFEDGEWCEWVDDYGDEIDQFLDSTDIAGSNPGAVQNNTERVRP